MSDERLKRIWSGFETKTSRRLTGSGVDNIVAPSRAREQEVPFDDPPAGYAAPAAAAFAALKRELADKERRGAKGRKAAAGPAPASSFGARTPPGPHEPMAEMLKGLAATERRVERPPLDYAAFRASLATDALNGGRRRKKFLGLF